MLKVRRRIVSRTVVHLHVVPVQLDGQMTIAPVPRGVARVESEDVIGFRIVLHLLKRRSEIVRVKERLAARIGRESSQRLLRAEVRIQLGLHRPAAVRCRAAQTPLRRIAHRRHRLQSTRIHAVDRHICLHRFIRCSPHARLIFNALPRQPPAEVQHALPLIHPFQALGDRANGVQLPICVQGVVLAVVRRKTGRIVRGSSRVAAFISIGKPRSFRSVVLSQPF